MPVAAVVGGVVSAAGSIYAAKKNAKASEQATDMAYQQFSEIKDQAQPFLQAGQSALSDIQNGNFKESPDYQFRLNEGMDAVTQNSAVNGLLRSGSALKGVTGFASNLASQEYNNWFNRKKSVVDTGMQGLGVQSGTATSTAQAAFANSANQANATNGMISGITGGIHMALGG